MKKEILIIGLCLLLIGCNKPPKITPCISCFEISDGIDDTPTIMMNIPFSNDTKGPVLSKVICTTCNKESNTTLG